MIETHYLQCCYSSSWIAVISHSSQSRLKRFKTTIIIMRLWKVQNQIKSG